MKEDTQLIDQVLNGDRYAFDLLIKRYYTECIQTATGLLKDAHLAKDLVQNACIQAYFCISNLKDKSLFRYWLLGIVKNVVKNYQKKNPQRYLSLQNYAQYLREHNETKELQRVTEIVAQHIDALPHTYKYIITQFYYENKNLKEIAQISGLSIETVKIRLYRGRKILKEALQAYSELYHYHQLLKQQHTMKKVRIADIVMSGTNKEACSILLQDEENSTVFLIIIGTGEAMGIVMALKNIHPPRPFVFNLAASMMKENNMKMDSIYIDEIVNGVFISKIKLRRGKKWQELDARPSDAITFALMFDCPMYVSQKVLDQVGFPVPEKYKHTTPKEKGISTLLEVIEDWKKNATPVRSKAKTAEEVQQSINKLIEFAFDE